MTEDETLNHAQLFPLCASVGNKGTRLLQADAKFQMNMLNMCSFLYNSNRKWMLYFISIHIYGMDNTLNHTELVRIRCDLCMNN